MCDILKRHPLHDFFTNFSPKIKAFKIFYLDLYVFVQK